MSRIAHKVFFMTDEVRNDFIEMIRRAADFCGIRLVAWCIMANHFHLLAYLPPPEDIDESEILRRFGVLKGRARLESLAAELAMKRLVAESGEDEAQNILSGIKSSMYDIGNFMKIVKQWLTQEYNKRYSHVGTLWEGVYKDVPVKATSGELAKRAGYIHLNPIRAGIVPGFSEYPWSSYTALCRGDDLAISGMRIIYGDDASREEMIDAHRSLMAGLLEQIKLEKAMDIARKRAAGFNPPSDPLTDEAMIAQAAAHVEKVINESVQLRLSIHAQEIGHLKLRGRPRGGNAEVAERIKALISEQPESGAAQIAKAVGISKSSVYAYLKAMRPRPKYSRK